MIEITIPDIPPSVNHYWIATGKRRFISKQGQYWKQLVAAIAANKYQILTNKLQVEIDIYFPDKRRRDIDNCSKAILDSLEGIIYKDDAQIHKLTLNKFYGDRKTIIKIKEFVN